MKQRNDRKPSESQEKKKRTREKETALEKKEPQQLNLTKGLMGIAKKKNKIPADPIR